MFFFEYSLRRCCSHLAALCGRVVERGELTENLGGLSVTQESLQQVEEIPLLKVKFHKKKERMNMKMLSTSVADPHVFGPPGS
jgi:hypothetical protein